MQYVGTPDFTHGTPARLGVLLVNLGTPDEPTTAAVRRYLAEFLWDPRVIEMSRPLWWLILHGIILRTRPAKSAHAYQKVWTPQGSPLMLESRALTQAVAARQLHVIETGQRAGGDRQTHQTGRETRPPEQGQPGQRAERAAQIMVKG